MFEMILSLGVSLLLFLCFIVGYREGLRLGMLSAKGVEPKAIKGPVKVVKDIVMDKQLEAEARRQAPQPKDR